VLGDGRLVAAKATQKPVAGRFGVGHSLQGSERFGGDDEQGFFRVEVAGGFDEIEAIDVRDKSESEPSFAVMPQGLISHDRSEIRSANADVHHRLDRLAGVAFPFAAADAVAEVRHFVENRVDIRDNVLAIDQDGGIPGSTQSGMENGPLFREVYFFTAEHGVDAL